MLRITRNHTFRVSNRLAVMAGLLLVLTAAVEVIEPFGGSAASDPAVVSTERALPAAETQPNRVSSTAARNKGFKVRLYLFRR